jgi:hypothetical protein
MGFGTVPIPKEETMTRMLQTWRAGLGLSLFAALALVAGGCTNAGNSGAQTKDGSKEKTAAVAQAKKVDDHSGWWCDEHGIPEEECSMCSSKVAKEFKAKGDWCEKHDRAKSQCFICDPSLKEKFAAKYRAKYGKEPPPTKDDDKKEGDTSKAGDKK